MKKANQNVGSRPEWRNPIWMKESAKEANQMYSLKLIKMKKPIRMKEANLSKEETSRLLKDAMASNI